MTANIPAKHTAQEVANWFIAWSESENEPITLIKLHNMLYYAQAHHLANWGKPLFDDEIIAVEHGAFIPTIKVSTSEQATETEV